MRVFSSYTIIFLFVLSSVNNANAQKADFNGQVAAWITTSNSGATFFQPGIRYVPQFTFKLPAFKNYKLDGELSADGYSNYTLQSDTDGYFDGKARLYRAWIRFSGNRFELRGGLQKINFGSASILRPLMWFDRVDPRDPLKLTSGVISLLGKYYFKNNANIWLWFLLGNGNSKGWESVPSALSRPEFGGRLQLPFPRGEVAFTYHNREARFPDGSQAQVAGKGYFTENRIGFDSKVDLGVGLWVEGTVTQRSNPYISGFEKALTIGSDYTPGFGQGLNIMVENMYVSMSESFASAGNSLNLTGLSLSVPFSVITRAYIIIFYDWKDGSLYNFANLSFTFNKIAINIIAFDNPRSFSLFNFSSGTNFFAGYGGQVMMIFNY